MTQTWEEWKEENNMPACINIRLLVTMKNKIEKESGENMKSIICKAQKDSMKDTPVWIDPVWQILHTKHQVSDASG